jgi:hypothetical protein
MQIKQIVACHARESGYEVVAPGAGPAKTGHRTGSS